MKLLLNHVNQQNNNQTTQKQWYETIGGLIVISLGLNLLSAYIYEQGRNQLRKLDLRKERRRERDHLRKFHNKTEKQAADIERAEEKSLTEQEQQNSILN